MNLKKTNNSGNKLSYVVKQINFVCNKSITMFFKDLKIIFKSTNTLLKCKTF